MSLLSQVTKGKIKQPVLTLIYGPDGVGKSSFGSEAPGAVFVGPEQGTANLDVARFPTPNDFNGIRGALHALATEKHDYKTVVLDSLDWIEPLVWKAVCELDGSSSIEDAQKGYQKGYIKALDFWKELMTDIRAVRAKGMNVVLIAHAQVKAFNDPSAPAPYDRYQLKLHEKASALFREFVDSVLFANYEIVARKENKNDKKVKPYGDDTRVIFTRRRPSFDAKNRYGLPFELEMVEGHMWETFSKAVDSGQPDSLESVKTDLVELAAAIKDESIRIKMMAAVEKAGTSVEALVKIRNHARVLAGEGT